MECNNFALRRCNLNSRLRERQVVAVPIEQYDSTALHPSGDSAGVPSPTSRRVNIGLTRTRLERGENFLKENRRVARVDLGHAAWSAADSRAASVGSNSAVAERESPSGWASTTVDSRHFCRKAIFTAIAMTIPKSAAPME